eukprot:GEMP01098063.1.p1 GENE.GEMP01098063.1~~GEMP01098063.1.p1  ORF type:complete len:138 (+),score=26.95 GEMP01098063.1:49-462(+)
MSQLLGEAPRKWTEDPPASYTRIDIAVCMGTMCFRSSSVFRQLAKEGEHIDLLFFDHGGSNYLPDLKEAMSLGILSKGCVIVADNVYFPPIASDFKEFVTTHECFNTTVHETFVEYTTWMPDRVSVSTFRGGAGCLK